MSKDWADVHPDDTGHILKLQEGSNIVRIASKPETCYDHWVPVRSKRNPGTTYQRRVVCPGVALCPICQIVQNNKKDPRSRKQRWVFKVIDRTTGEVKVMQPVGWQVVRPLRDMDDMHKKGTFPSLKEFDVDIRRGKQGGNPLYTVFNHQPTKLTQEEYDKYAQTNNAVDPKKETEPTPVEEIQLMLHGIDPRTQEIEDDDNANFGDASFAATPQPAAQAAPVGTGYAPTPAPSFNPSPVAPRTVAPAPQAFARPVPPPPPLPARQVAPASFGGPNPTPAPQRQAAPPVPASDDFFGEDIVL